MSSKASCCSPSSAELPRLGQSSLLLVFHRHTPLFNPPPYVEGATPPMRLNCFVLVVVFTLAACCQGLSNADGTVLIKSNRQLTSGDNNVERHLKGAKTTATEVADEERGLSKLTAFLEKIPYLNKVKGAVGTGTNSVKIAVAEVREIAKKDKHPAVSVAISLLKMLVFVGVVSVATGYIVYRVTNS